MNVVNAYYLKLGTAGKWAGDGIKNGRARIGWTRIPLVAIAKRDWPTVEQMIRTNASAKGEAKGVATMDINALKRFCNATGDDVWITFHESKLWWGRLADGPVQEDGISRYREVVGGWKCENEKGKPLLANQIPGRIAQLQAYRATLCRVRAKDALVRLLAGEPSPEFLAVKEAKVLLAAKLEHAIRHLHWKDFELLVDLVFRQSGWRRVSMVGEAMKSVDMELEDSITGYQYQVQVKSKASRVTLQKYRDEFLASGSEYEKFYFVVHTPEGNLASVEGDDKEDRFEVILADRLADMVIRAGLTDWVMDKIA